MTKKFELVFTFDQRPTLETLTKIGAGVPDKYSRDWDLREVEDDGVVAPVVEVVSALPAPQPDAVIGNRTRRGWERWEEELARDERVSDAELARRTSRSKQAVVSKRWSINNDQHVKSGVSPKRWSVEEEQVLIDLNVEPTDKQEVADAAELLGRTTQSVIPRCNKLIAEGRYTTERRRKRA